MITPLGFIGAHNHPDLGRLHDDLRPALPLVLLHLIDAVIATVGLLHRPFGKAGHVPNRVGVIHRPQSIEIPTVERVIRAARQTHRQHVAETSVRVAFPDRPEAASQTLVQAREADRQLIL